MFLETTFFKHLNDHIFWQKRVKGGGGGQENMVEHCHILFGREIRLSSHCTVATSVTTDDPAAAWAIGIDD